MSAVYSDKGYLILGGQQITCSNIQIIGTEPGRISSKEKHHSPTELARLFRDMTFTVRREASPTTAERLGVHHKDSGRHNYGRNKGSKSGYQAGKASPKLFRKKNGS